jgi:bifunctional non-homologous end joining protein LigD
MRPSTVGSSGPKKVPHFPPAEILLEPAVLPWLANFGAIELHPWNACADRFSEPSYAYIDIDPGTATSWEQVLILARLYRTALEQLDVAGWPKVTGRRGIQVWVPVRPGLTFDDTRDWVEALSRVVASPVPELVSWAWEVRARKGLARLDFTQNAINKTLVAPYSVRPAPGAPVSVPITWDELDDPALRPDRWTIADVGARLAEAGDPFATMIGVTQDLPALG